MQGELYVEKSIVKPLEKLLKVCYTLSAHYAGVMELADVPDSKSGGSDTVRVRPPPPAPKIDRFRPVDFLSVAATTAWHQREACTLWVGCTIGSLSLVTVCVKAFYIARSCGQGKRGGSYRQTYKNCAYGAGSHNTYCKQYYRKQCCTQYTCQKGID